jgi:hypothetical protein
VQSREASPTMESSFTSRFKRGLTPIMDPIVPR